jgi:hypothetical protein
MHKENNAHTLIYVYMFFISIPFVLESLSTSAHARVRILDLPFKLVTMEGAVTRSAVMDFGWEEQLQLGI